MSSAESVTPCHSDAALEGERCHRVLIVDDDRVQRLMLSKALSQAGYQTLMASDGVQALAAYAESSPDMVLLDVMMPHMDGFECCRRLRQQPSIERVPIFMLTGLDDTEAVARAFEAGATDFIAKPINLTMLGQRVRYALRAFDNAHALRVSQQRLMHAQQLARLSYWEWELASDRLVWSDNAPDLFNIPTEALPSTFTELARQIQSEDRARLTAALYRLRRDGGQVEEGFRLINAAGETRHIRCVAEVARDGMGRITQVTGSLQDITRLQLAEALIDYQKYHDGLTELPNRRFLLERLATLIAQRDGDEQLGIIVLGVDRFKMINASLGAANGDRVLHMLAQRLRAVDIEGRLARLGGGEFAFLLESQGCIVRLVSLAEQIQQVVAEPFVLDDMSVVLTASLGAALCPTDADQAHALLGCAEAARARSKAAGGNQFQCFTRELTAQAARRLRLENELRQALAKDQLSVYYQPQVASTDLWITGAEVLVRWEHPQLGRISPAEFIPIAEETGLIIDIGEWVLATACEQAAAWTRAGLGELHIGVNLSTRQLTWVHLVERVQHILNETGLSPAQLDLEITETLAMQNPEANVRLLEQLAELGITLAIDDFGTGHSSLNYLHKFPVAILKIDRSFVTQLESQQSGKGIVTTIIGLARVLGLRVIAEGVETLAQLQFLREHGCDYLQGYYFGRPMSAAAFAEQITAQHRHPPPPSLIGAFP